jgi:hypothetical protein
MFLGNEYAFCPPQSVLILTASLRSVQNESASGQKHMKPKWVWHGSANIDFIVILISRESKIWKIQNHNADQSECKGS